MRWTVIAWFMRVRSPPGLPEFEQFEPERFDLREDAEQGGPVLERAGEHGVAAVELGHHRGEGGEGGGSESTLYADRVQAGRCGHVMIVQPDLVSRRRRNLVIVGALVRRCAWTLG